MSRRNGGSQSHISISTTEIDSHIHPKASVGSRSTLNTYPLTVGRSNRVHGKKIKKEKLKFFCDRKKKTINVPIFNESDVFSFTKKTGHTHCELDTDFDVESGDELVKNAVVQRTNALGRSLDLIRS